LQIKAILESFLSLGQTADPDKSEQHNSGTGTLDRKVQNVSFRGISESSAVKVCEENTETCLAFGPPRLPSQDGRAKEDKFSKGFSLENNSAQDSA